MVPDATYTRTSLTDEVNVNKLNDNVQTDENIVESSFQSSDFFLCDSDECG